MLEACPLANIPRMASLAFSTRGVEQRRPLLIISVRQGNTCARSNIRRPRITGTLVDLDLTLSTTASKKGRSHYPGRVGMQVTTSVTTAFSYRTSHQTIALQATCRALV